jgi:benzoyl-CoA-dihydrodiol lyase
MSQTPTAPATAVAQPLTAPRVDYQTSPAQYRHWKLKFEGAVATLAADFDEAGGLAPGYKLKLNSYDLGVDIELNDAIQRIRFEHPEVRTVVLTSAKEKVFCSGANIFMLGLSTHGWKVNFCKFTNETRNGFEDSSKHSGLKFLAAVNGACAGGGYELALACDEIILVDDRSSAVSLPEVPLLGVLPGTGGLTRVTDKRKVRHDLADLFCTSAEGVRGQKAKDWRLVDDIAKPAAFAARVQERALELAKGSDRPANGKGALFTPLQRTIEADALRYGNVVVEIDRAKRTATWTIKAPTTAVAADVATIEAQGAAWYPLALARELEDAILSMRTNELEIGTWLIKTEGDAAQVQAMDAVLLAHQNHWLVRETTGYLRRTFSRLDVSSRSLFALIEPGSCFVGSFLELALACDRSYQLILPRRRRLA